MDAKVDFWYSFFTVQSLSRSFDNSVRADAFGLYAQEERSEGDSSEQGCWMGLGLDFCCHLRGNARSGGKSDWRSTWLESRGAVTSSRRGFDFVWLASTEKRAMENRKRDWSRHHVDGADTCHIVQCQL